MRTYEPRNASEISYFSPIRASRLAALVHADVQGPDIEIKGASTYGAKYAGSLCYQVLRAPEEEDVERAVFCTKEIAPFIAASTKLIVRDPQKAMMHTLTQTNPDWEKTVHRVVDRLGYEEGSSQIHPTAYVENGSFVANGTIIEPNVVIRSGTIVGPNSIIAAGSISGTHGPAIYKTLSGSILSWRKIHFGTAQIGQNVEIGANCVILRAILGRTMIGDNTLIGNIVHIGHGCEVRKRVWIAANVTICGHAFIDDGASIGAGATIRDNVDILEGASVGMGSVVVNHVSPKQRVLGVPAKPVPDQFQSGPER